MNNWERAKILNDTWLSSNIDFVRQRSFDDRNECRPKYFSPSMDSIWTVIVFMSANSLEEMLDHHRIFFSSFYSRLMDILFHLQGYQFQQREYVLWRSHLKINFFENLTPLMIILLKSVRWSLNVQFLSLSNILWNLWNRIMWSSSYEEDNFDFLFALVIRMTITGSLLSFSLSDELVCRVLLVFSLDWWSKECKHPFFSYYYHKRLLTACQKEKEKHDVQELQ